MDETKSLQSVPITHGSDMEKVEYDDDGPQTRIKADNSENTKFILEDTNPHGCTSANTPMPEMSIKHVWFNLITFSVSFLVLFSAVLSFSNLQSTLNQEEGLGTVGLTVIYVTMLLTSLFLPPLVLSKFPLKWITVVSILAYLSYLATGYYPSWATILPASALLGLGSALLWTANLAYITNLAKMYAALTNTDNSKCITQFFSVFFFIYSTTHVWGNLYSSLVLQVDNQNMSVTMSTNKQCGAEFCSDEDTNYTRIAQPPKHQVYMFTSICIGLGVIAALGVAVFTANIPNNTDQGRVKVKEHLKEVLTLIFKDRRQRLLICPSIYRGMSQGFPIVDFTIAFVSCPIGVENVGFVMIAFGLTGALSSFIYGKISPYIGLYPLFCLAFLVQTTGCIVMLLWKPDSSQPVIIYVLAGLWAVGDSVHQTIVSVMYSVYFKDRQDAAFSSFCFLNAIGVALTFSYSAFLCTWYKLYIIQAVMVISHASITMFFVNVGELKCFKPCGFR